MLLKYGLCRRKPVIKPQVGLPTNIMPSSSSVSVPVSLAVRVFPREEIEEEVKDEDVPFTSGVVSRDSGSVPITGDKVVEIVDSTGPESEGGSCGAPWA